MFFFFTFETVIFHTMSCGKYSFKCSYVPLAFLIVFFSLRLVQCNPGLWHYYGDKLEQGHAMPSDLSLYFQDTYKNSFTVVRHAAVLCEGGIVFALPQLA